MKAVGLSAQPPLVLTVDMGSTSVRALLYDRDARPVPGVEARRRVAMQTTPDGGVEADADGLVALALECIDEAVAQAAGRRNISAVAFSTFWHSLVGVGARGEALTPVYTWADTRAVVDHELRKALDERAAHARTGCLFHPSYLPAKLLWLSRELPDIFRRTVLWMSPGELLFFRLFGRPQVTASMASGTGLFDVHRLAWDPEILGAVSVRQDQLSPIGEAPFQGLVEPYSARWPALRQVLWFPPVGDGALNNFGSGCTGPDKLAVMVGTSGAMRVVKAAADLDIPWGVFGYRADGKRFVLGGALSDGGNFLEWVRGAYRIEPGDERAALEMEPDAHGLTFLPLLAGERSPGWASQARGAVAGLSLASKPAHIWRAALEAVAYRFELIRRLLAPAAPEIREAVASGGALLARTGWIAMLADVLGLDVVASGEAEASSRGAALLALEAMGAIGSIDDAPAEFGQRFEPDRKKHVRYGLAIDRQRKLYDILVGGFFER